MVYVVEKRSTRPPYWLIFGIALCARSIIYNLFINCSIPHLFQRHFHLINLSVCTVVIFHYLIQFRSDVFVFSVLISQLGCKFGSFVFKVQLFLKKGNFRETRLGTL